MKHEPKLTVYTIKLKPATNGIENSNRWLFRNIIGEANQNELSDTFVFGEIFRKFIQLLDTEEMYSDSNSNKCMTANQPDIEDENVNTNIIPHNSQYIIEGKVEGGSFGKRRNKTSTTNKRDKSLVSENDAITEDFYFLLYTPLYSNKSTLFIQSYSDDSIDSVMKKFWQNFFKFPNQFNMPVIKRFIPKSIIENFRRNATVSNLVFSTDIPGETLLESTSTQTTKNYKVTVKITPLDGDLSMEDFSNEIEPIQSTYFTRLMNLGQFRKKKGVLKDQSTNNTTPFDIGSSFEIQPCIIISKYKSLNGDENDFDKIKELCFELLHEIKPEIYTDHAIQER